MDQGMAACAARAMETMASAITEPTDRSMPPVIMTTSIPSASNASEAFCFSIFVRFSAYRNTVGLIKANTSIINMTTIMMP
jgi:hypothetical protein